MATRRVPFVAQMEVSECGAACLGMILGSYGSDVPLPELRADCDIGRDGVSAKALARAAARHGLTARGLKCSVDALAQLRLPLVLHWEFNHFVVLERVQGQRFSLIDPGAGRRQLGREELQRSFTGVALELVPRTDMPKRRVARSWTRGLLGALRPYCGVGLTLLGVLLVHELLGVGVPILEQVLLDQVLIAGRHDWLGALLLIGASVGLLVPCVQYVQTRLIARLRGAAAMRHVVSLVVELTRASPSFLLQRSSGDLAQRVRAQEDVQELAIKLVAHVLDAAMCVSGTLVLLWYHRSLGALAALFCCLRAFGAGLAEWRGRDLATSELVASAKEQSARADALMAQEVLRGLHATGSAERAFERHVARRLNASLQAEATARAISTALSLLDGFSQSLLLVLAGRAVLEGQLSTGAFAAFIALGRLLHRPMVSLASCFGDLVRLRMLEPMLRDVREQRPQLWGTDATSLSGAMELTALSFQYEGVAAATLDNISLSVLPGEVLGICGRSGSGKSTLGRLIARLLEPSAGEVRFDGKPPAALCEAAFREQVRLVTQDPFLCEGSVRSNVALAVDEPTGAELESALWRAHADELVAGLPWGIETEVGPGGARLSGGERQRLALARALVATPRILILDETTSCLDAGAEAELARRLSGLRCTQVVISHRLRTLLRADRVAVLERGVIVQLGRPSELLARPGLFHELFAADARREASA